MAFLLYKKSFWDVYVLSTTRFLKQILQVHLKYNYIFPQWTWKLCGTQEEIIIEKILQQDALLKKIKKMLSIRFLITIDSAVTGSQYMIRKGKRPHHYQELFSVCKIHLFLVCKCIECLRQLQKH